VEPGGVVITVMELAVELEGLLDVEVEEVLDVEDVLDVFEVLEVEDDDVVLAG